MEVHPKTSGWKVVLRLWNGSDYKDNINAGLPLNVLIDGGCRFLPALQTGPSLKMSAGHFLNAPSGCMLQGCRFHVAGSIDFRKEVEVLNEPISGIRIRHSVWKINLFGEPDNLQPATRNNLPNSFY